MGFHVLLQGIFLIQGSNPGLPHCRGILYSLSHEGLQMTIYIYIYIYIYSHSYSKESTCNAGDLSSIPGPGRSTQEGIGYPLQYSWASLVAQVVRNLPAMQETWVWSLGWEYSLEKRKATHPSILAWRIPCVYTHTHTHTHTHTPRIYKLDVYLMCIRCFEKVIAGYNILLFPKLISQNILQ